MRQIIPILASAVLLASCMTPYAPNGAMGGFEEVKLSESMYRVSVQGNGYTTPQRAQEILLLRSSELTLNSGFSKFQVANAETANQADLVYCGAYCGFNTINRPNGSYVIRMFSDAAAPADAFDAATIKGQLYPKLVPKTSTTKKVAGV